MYLYNGTGLDWLRTIFIVIFFVLVNLFVLLKYWGEIKWGQTD